MAIIGLTLAVIAFIEAALFLYLRSCRSEVAAVKSSIDGYHREAKTLFDEATLMYNEAEQMYDESKRLLVQAQAETETLSSSI